MLRCEKPQRRLQWTLVLISHDSVSFHIRVTNTCGRGKNSPGILRKAKVTTFFELVLYSVQISLTGNSSVFIGSFTQYGHNCGTLCVAEDDLWIFGKTSNVGNTFVQCMNVLLCSLDKTLGCLFPFWVSVLKNGNSKSIWHRVNRRLWAYLVSEELRRFVVHIGHVIARGVCQSAVVYPRFIAI